MIPQAIDAVHLLEPLYEAVDLRHGGVPQRCSTPSAGTRPAAGPGALSIVGLVVVIRILLIPLFVKQINAQRGLQILQPEIKKIQAKYKGKTDRRVGRSSSKR